MFKWTTFNCWFNLLSDKLQNVSQSVNVSSLETVCLTTVKCQIMCTKCPQERVNSLLRMLSKSVTFLDYWFAQGSIILQVTWKFLQCVHREFYCESAGERLLKISPHLPKLLTNQSTFAKVINKLQVAHFFETVYIPTYWSDYPYVFIL